MERSDKPSPPAKRPSRKRVLPAADVSVSDLPPVQAEAPAVPAVSVVPSIAGRGRMFASELFGDLERLREQLFAPVVRREVRVVAGSKGEPNEVRIVDVDLNEPTFADKKVIVQTIALGLEQVLSLARETGDSPETNVGRVVTFLESMRGHGPMDTGDEALGQLALTLARNLDEGAGMAAAAIAKELRATLSALAKEPDEPDALFGTDLPPPVRDSTEP